MSPTLFGTVLVWAPFPIHSIFIPRLPCLRAFGMKAANVWGHPSILASIEDAPREIGMLLIVYFEIGRNRDALNCLFSQSTPAAIFPDSCLADFGAFPTCCAPRTNHLTRVQACVTKCR
jgi:hypothetical protein